MGNCLKKSKKQELTLKGDLLKLHLIWPIDCFVHIGKDNTVRDLLFLSIRKIGLTYDSGIPGTVIVFSDNELPMESTLGLLGIETDASYEIQLKDKLDINILIRLDLIDNYIQKLTCITKSGLFKIRAHRHPLTLTNHRALYPSYYNGAICDMCARMIRSPNEYFLHCTKCSTIWTDGRVGYDICTICYNEVKDEVNDDVNLILT